MLVRLSAAALAMLGATFLSPAQVRAADLDACSGSRLEVAQCQCNMALSIGTPTALQKFMHSYSSKGTACAATASTAPVSHGGNGGDNSRTGGGGSSSGGTPNRPGNSGGVDPSDGNGSDPNGGSDTPPSGGGSIPKG